MTGQGYRRRQPRQKPPPPTARKCRWPRRRPPPGCRLVTSRAGSAAACTAGGSPRASRADDSAEAGRRWTSDRRTARREAATRGRPQSNQICSGRSAATERPRSAPEFPGAAASVPDQPQSAPAASVPGQPGSSPPPQATPPGTDTAERPGQPLHRRRPRPHRLGFGGDAAEGLRPGVLRVLRAADLPLGSRLPSRHCGAGELRRPPRSQGSREAQRREPLIAASFSTRSAWESTDSVIVILRTLATLPSTMTSNLVGAPVERSTDLAPFKS